MSRDHTCSIDGCEKPVHCRGWCHAHYRRLRIGLVYPPRGEIERFFQQQVLQYDGDDCLTWPYSRPHGRAEMWVPGGRKVNVCRRICEHIYGPPPTPEHEAAHSCGKGHLGCVAKRHLRWATHAENLADRRDHGTDNAGDRNGRSKLSEEDAKTIIALIGKQSYGTIAKKFGVSSTHIGEIQRGTSWRHLERPQS